VRAYFPYYYLDLVPFFRATMQLLSDVNFDETIHAQRKKVFLAKQENMDGDFRLDGGNLL